jgi:hypothetical protein
MTKFIFKNKEWFDITIEAPDENEAVKSYNQFRKKEFKIYVKK